MKAGDLACYLTHDCVPVLLLRRGSNPDPASWDTWIISLNGKEVEAWSEDLVLWKDREKENIKT